MMRFLAARRGPLAFIALYATIALFFIAQEIMSWGDADAHQESTREELRVLTSRAAANGIAAGPGIAARFVAASETQAIASFDALVRTTIAGSGGVVVSSRSEPRTDTSDENAIMISAVFEGGIAVVQSALYKLETGSPIIYVDRAAMDPADGEASSSDPRLHVSLSLSSRWALAP
jgi:predicted permease